MPVSEKPLVERIARVLAGAALSSNAEGSDPSAGEKVDLAWREHVNQALAVLHTHARAGRGMAAAGDADVWRKMVEAAIARTRRLSPRDAQRGEQDRGPTRAGRSSPASSPRACPSSKARCSTSRCPRSAQATAPARRKCSGWSTPICCRCRRCCCSAARSATISGAAAAGHRHQHLRRHVAGLRACAEPADPARRARRARHRRGAAAAQQPRAAQRRLPGREARARGRHLGGAGAAAAAIAPLIGGWLVGTVGWPAIFYINLPLALGAILLAAAIRRRKPRSRRGTHRLCRRAAGDGGPRRPHLRADPVVGDAALHDAGRHRAWPSALVMLRGFPVGRTPPRQPGDDAARPVRRPLLLRPQPADLPALRRVRRGDAADPLRADHAAAAIRRSRPAWRCCRCRS